MSSPFASHGSTGTRPGAVGEKWLSLRERLSEFILPAVNLISKTMKWPTAMANQNV